MRLWGLAFAAIAWAAALAAQFGEDPYVVLVAGDVDGYMSPCGCTKPMTGGIRRKATAVRAASIEGRTILLENGGLIAGTGRQDELKLETQAEALRSMGANVINWGPQESRLGPGAALSADRLSGGRVASAVVAPGGTFEPKRIMVEGPFVVGAVASDPDATARPIGATPVALDRAVREVVDQAAELEKTPVLLLQGNRAEAERLARAFPAVRLIAYRSTGDAPDGPVRIGNTWLTTPGESGKSLLRLTFRNGQFESYQILRLGPSYADDPEVARIYQNYLNRVSAEGLLEKLPRLDTAAYAGSEKCFPCHQDVAAIYTKTQHADALKTLEDDGHDRDPECVSCHVTGLESTKGYVSRLKTPLLANVGCESCHGPAAAHAADPKNNPLKTVTEKECRTCHTPTTSPNFNFPAYWARIKHP